MEFSDDFDAVQWHYDRMSAPDYDEYYDDYDNNLIGGDSDLMGEY